MQSEDCRLIWNIQPPKLNFCSYEFALNHIGGSMSLEEPTVE